MAYRRKQGMQRSATFVEDHRYQQPPPGDTSSPAIASPRATRFADDSRRPDRSLAAQAMLASAASRRDVPAFIAAAAAAERFHTASSPQPDGPALDPVIQLYTSMSSTNDDPKYAQLKKDETKHGFWGVLAQQAKVMLDENGGGTEDGRDQYSLGSSGGIQPSQSRWSYDRVRNPENPTLDIGGKIKNVLEEGLTKAEGNRTGGAADVVHARKLQIRRKACSMDLRNTSLNLVSPDMSPMLSDSESPQVKASRDVANAMAAKVKLLQRELKTVKADMAFAKERCAQLEEENRLLRDGDADEDLIRQQLETLLAEKARLANENTVYAMENRFLREIVEFHQLNMQDVVNLDEDMMDDEEEEDDGGGGASQQYRCHLQLHQAGYILSAGGPATAPQSPLGHAGRLRMSRSNSGAAAESPMRRRFTDNVGAPETPPTRRSLKEDVDAPETPHTRRSIKADDVDAPDTPPTRRSLKEDDDAPETPPTRRSLKEDDVDAPQTPPTRRSLKEDDADVPDTPPTRQSVKEDVDAPETPPTRRSFNEDIGAPEKVTTPTNRGSSEDLGAPETTMPTRLSFTNDVDSTEMKNKD